jgi:hypothetical protein
MNKEERKREKRNDEQLLFEMTDAFFQPIAVLVLIMIRMILSVSVDLNRCSGGGCSGLRSRGRGIQMIRESLADCCCIN